MMDSELNGRDELAADTLERLRRHLAEGETPCVARIIELINRMSDQADVMSTQDLAEAIGSDMTAMIKVMKAANCLQFNPSALEVSTVTRAVSVIGFNKIQNLALSLLLLEGAENQRNTPESCEVSARALCSALLAEELSRQQAIRDPEEAFVGSALRAYGRLLLSSFLIDEFREALALAQTMPEDRAFQLVFGLTPLEISRHLLEHVNIGKHGTRMFQPLSPALVRNKHLSREESLQLGASLGAAISDLLNEPGLTPAEFELRSDLCLDQYRPALSLDRDGLKSVFDRVRGRLDDFGRAEGLQVFSSSLLERIRCLAEGKDFAADPERRPRPRPASATPESLLPARGPLAAAVKRIREAINAPGRSAATAYSLAAGAVRSALRLEACVVFARDGNTDGFLALAGEGAFFRQIERSVQLDPARRDVFTVSIAKGEDVLIRDSADPRIASFIPAWFHAGLQGGGFVLLPIKDLNGVFAIICGIAPRGQHIDLGVTRISQFRTIRKLLATLRAPVAVAPTSEDLPNQAGEVANDPGKAPSLPPPASPAPPIAASARPAA